MKKINMTNKMKMTSIGYRLAGSVEVDGGPSQVHEALHMAVCGDVCTAGKRENREWWASEWLTLDTGQDTRPMQRGYIFYLRSGYG